MKTILLHSVQTFQSIPEILIDALKESFQIAVFVFFMMMLIEYLNVIMKGRFSSYFKNNKLPVNFLIPFLGTTPGCLGSFLNASLYSHNLISIGAITAGMIATVGDDFFIMLEQMAFKDVMFLMGILYIIAVGSIPVVNGIARKLKWFKHNPCDNLVIHEHEHESASLQPKQTFSLKLKNISFQRGLLAFIIAFLLAGYGLGEIGPKEWDAFRIIFIASSFIGLFIVLTASEHFLNDHVWKHVIKHHLPSIFIWTFGIIAALAIAMKFIHLESFIQDNMLFMVLLAAIAGIFPTVGPNIIFITLFANGVIPFSILLTNAIVQDGHGMLPILANSRKEFIRIKILNLSIGLIIGLIVYFLGY